MIDSSASCMGCYEPAYTLEPFGAPGSRMGLREDIGDGQEGNGLFFQGMLQAGYILNTSHLQDLIILLHFLGRPNVLSG